MSWSDAPSPGCDHHDARSCLSHVLSGRPRDLGGFKVRRVLPDAAVASVGPFIFFDHFGPTTVPPGGGMNVRPHPHIHLATLTYLFEGSVMHRDSLGSALEITPGAINLMVAGRGIAHSERTPLHLQDQAFALHGLQLWLALPQAHQETDPAFSHHPADTLPMRATDGVILRQLVGTAFGLTSPVPTLSPMFYTDVQLDAGAQLGIPEGHIERAAYIVSGTVTCAGERYAPGQLLVFRPGPEAPPLAAADGPARLVLLGGDPLDGRRHMWWNFASTDPLRIEQAKKDWHEGRFPPVPGDTEERIPLPAEEPHVLPLETDTGGEFVIFRQGERLGEMTWRRAEDGAVMDILHTGVREALQGTGWARRLVLYGVGWARKQGMTILPHCPYARKVITGDPDLQDVLTPDWEAKL